MEKGTQPSAILRIARLVPKQLIFQKPNFFNHTNSAVLMYYAEKGGLTKTKCTNSTRFLANEKALRLKCPFDKVRRKTALFVISLRIEVPYVPYEDRISYVLSHAGHV